MLNFLRKIIQEVNSAQNLPEALNVVVERICEFMSVESVAIFILDETDEHFLLIASKGYKPAAVGKLRIKKDIGLVGLIAKREEPINLEDCQAHEKYVYYPETGEEIYKALLGVPIIHQRKVLGVMVAQQRDMRKFDENEEALMVTVSAQLAGVIAQAKAQGGLEAIEQAVKSKPGRQFRGIPGAPGVGLGEAVRSYALADLDAVPDRQIDDIHKEIEIFNEALELARDEIKVLAKRLHASLPLEEQALFDAYLKILDNESLGSEVIAQIKQNNWAQGALRSVIKQHVHHYEEMEDEYLRERAADLRDLGRRVLTYLQAEQQSTPSYPNQIILVGEEITAAKLAEIPREKLVGIVSCRGSSNSHVAILARSMGIPTVMGAEDLPLVNIEGQELIVDGYHGKVYMSPSPTLRREFQRLMKEEQELYAGLEALQTEQAITPDGHHVPLLVNAGLAADIPSSLDVGAEGVGLYRTEVPFMVRDRFPSEEEQRQIYRQMLEAFSPRPVIMRTLDVGGDKALPYFSIKEENPFLGWRGLRITLDHPEFFLVQIRAMLLASSGLNNLNIMLPMVSSISEVLEAKKLIQQAYDEVVAEDSNIDFPRVGAMIEVPSAVYQAEEFAAECDFLSVGSNDLTQYLLAVDRNNSRVARIYDSLHPSVLRALIDVVTATHAQGKPASICGEMAGDPASAILLLAMGYNTLSMSATSLTSVKWVIRNFTLKQAQTLLAEALTLRDPQSIRHLLEDALQKAGLGGLVRAGK